MDMLVEEEDSPYVTEEPKPRGIWKWAASMLEFLADYGWHMVILAAVLAYILVKVRPIIEKWQQARADAAYHKDPDVALARLDAVQRARARQQQLLEDASRRAAELQREREERKRAEALERLQKYGAAAGHKLGAADDDYLPLSGGASTSSYRPPKRSACAKGGCGG